MSSASRDASAPAVAPLTPGARRVLAAAGELFYDRGIHAVGVDAIAEAAGVTKKTLYDRFGSKDALVLAYLQDRDTRWRAHLETTLAGVPERGPERILAVFDAAISWSDANSPKGCSAINARAESPRVDGDVLAETTRQKRWLLDVFVTLCREAGVDLPEQTARSMMLLYEGAIVTVGMETFPQPFQVARGLARTILSAGHDPRDRAAPGSGPR
ncbi:TetR/AcrR family transcriptional regulator [Microbacterium sp. 18062]|uniref:TetR/AcrR family transcriptional regulator n=1 Tax=Microbacterium sp. 18062 TaxID=2681410 RepID=UPI001359CF7C|nr:TetR/AcrR family transcriptional regulator [Microbacterium sp. 18062]